MKNLIAGKRTDMENTSYDVRKKISVEGIKKR